MAFDAHSTAAPSVLPFPTKRKRRFETARLGKDETPPANVVRLARPTPAPAPMTRTPAIAALDSLAWAMTGKTFTRWCGRLASEARAGDVNAFVALQIITGAAK